jgi:hypothetical protein
MANYHLWSLLFRITANVPDRCQERVICLRTHLVDISWNCNTSWVILWAEPWPTSRRPFRLCRFDSVGLGMCSAIYDIRDFSLKFPTPFVQLLRRWAHLTLLHLHAVMDVDTFVTSDNQEMVYRALFLLCACFLQSSNFVMFCWRHEASVAMSTIHSSRIYNMLMTLCRQYCTLLRI